MSEFSEDVATDSSPTPPESRRNHTGETDVVGSLGTSAARGGMAVLVGQICRIFIQVTSVSVLARLLLPADYGLVAIVMAVIGVGEIFRDFGLSTAAVRAKVLTIGQRDKLFWLNAGIGLFLMALAVVAAPIIAGVFHHVALTNITRALSLTFFVNGLTAQYEADLTRSLRFTVIVIVNVASQVAGTIIAIITASIGAGYWALVFQQLVTGIFTLGAFAILAGWIPGRIRRDGDVRSLVRFGAGVALSQVINYANSNVDTLTIGIRFSAAQLGYYNRGFQLLMRPLGQLRAPTTSIVLPILRLVSDDRSRADRVLVRGQRALGYSLVAGLAFAAATAKPVVALFLGDRWVSVVPVFAILAVAGIFQTVAYVGNWVFLARGLTRDLVRFSIVSLAIKVVCVLVGSVWGIVGVAAGFALAPAITLPISISWLGRSTELPVRELYAGACRILMAAALSGSGAYAATRALAGAPDVAQICVGVAAGVAVYGALAALSASYRLEIVDVCSTAVAAIRDRRGRAQA